MIRFSRSRRALSTAAVALALTVGFADHAEARRGGSFGSRGMRTYSPPRSTYTTPRYTPPVSRSMTPNTGGFGQGGQRYGQNGFNRPGYAGANRGGFLRRWGGPLLGGLALGGLLGMMMGHGFGGGAGFLGLLLQLAIAFFVVRFLIGLFRRRQEAQPAGGPMSRDGFGGPQPAYPPSGADQGGGFLGGGPAPYQSGGYAPQGGPAPLGQPVQPQGGPADEIGLQPQDFDAFERLLKEVQGAFGREDYGALRQITTPEIMSYLSEELSQNAVAGRRNEVRDIRLLQGDLSEAWREGDDEYATVAMRYESIDVMRDRNGGQVLQGSPDRATETAEVWTFVRHQGGPWRLSAIQDAGAA